MAGEVYIKGDTGTLAYWDGDAYKPVVCLTSSSHELTMNTVEKVNMCNAGKTIQSPQSISESVQIEGEVIDTTAVGGVTPGVTVGELKALARAQVTAGVGDDFRLNRGPEGFIYFKALLSNVSDSYQAGEDATFSATLTITNDPTEVDPHTP
ncbi:hypothetical protein GQF61_04195 [Sphingobacterium sp. DK4209]|uniref:Phage tail protein n=1 Tax=Sphingobacterium zhuxiongii TaxID=2662364 RepID=A0A5Q0Q5R2_9SPHI|nr:MULTISPECIES: hypothetical protein [unclassified Sphingobacterium]MVZ65040.1 hypothetical protein [Sphingobacterium sp. DK4209]QGA25377.1 hypothetical protein GFH32_03150 [Sphingobacterium sp. dk4302]